MPCLASSHLSVLSRLRAAEISPASKPGRGSVLSSLLLRLVTHLADLDWQQAVHFCPFLVFERIFQSNNSPGGVSKFWATVYLGPNFLLKNLQKIPVCIPNWLWLLSMPSSPQGRQSWAGGSWEMRIMQGSPLRMELRYMAGSVKEREENESH